VIFKVANAQAVLERACAPNSVLRRIAAEAIEFRKGASAILMVANDQTKFESDWDCKSSVDSNALAKIK